MGPVDLDMLAFERAVENIPFSQRDLSLSLAFYASNPEVHVNRCLLNYFHTNSHDCECCFIIRMFSTYVAKYLAPDTLLNNYPCLLKKINLLPSSTVSNMNPGNSEEGTEKQAKSV